MKVAGSLPRVTRVALLALLTTLLTAAAAQAATRAALTPAAKTPYDASLYSCKRSPRTDVRSAIVAASMRPVGSGRRLALRVELYQRALTGGRWALRSDVPGLGVWTNPSDPTIGTRPNDVFKYRQAVGRLVVPYAYRFRVSFRWSDASGTVVREAVATTAICKEPDLRPDLSFSDVAVEDGPTADTSSYTVTVRNSGRSPAWNVGVTWSLSSATRSLKRLGPLESAEVSFVGARCQGPTGPTFLVDPANAIDEVRETNNSLLATCPATLEQP
ncbi:CARDB domain-containing protein [Conexibacter sp. JD483]|uniref:CARDB domain-containing protein n=1 Tax=unclassified Conexibacter TaxID=2627773 RepID=UPI002720BEB5|nr:MULTISPECIES: CARDB domain-containing protein [unclassified Conexibacter]MDO8186747.1 CARDB domain-containing protein [Conexibacter sp. CPCC 205706]MDO8199033.1 CARDB domain-containing protein [Conexibacter sp. CPCC 205762]MDR9368485.1 CARDB domain-containing protein [Conexibacter sp. JD483]